MTRKSAYVAKARTVLQEQQVKAAQVKSRVRGNNRKGQCAQAEDIARLDGLLKQAHTRVLSLMQAGEETWEDVRDRLEKTWVDITQALNGLTGTPSVSLAKGASPRPRTLSATVPRRKRRKRSAVN